MIKRLALLLLTTVQLAFGANYYVTQSGAGTGDGSSAANAWSLSAFNGSTKPTGGDTVFFSGSFSGGVTPNANGTSGAQLVLDFSAATLSTSLSLNSRNYLTLTGGTTSPSYTTGIAISASRCTSLTINGWTFNSSDANGWPTFISFGGCTNVTISNCKAQNTGYGFQGDNNTGVLITGNDVRTSTNGTTNSGNQTDVIHLGGGRNIIVEKNKLVLRAPGCGCSGADGSYRHNDVIQTYATGGSGGASPANWTIRYNWIENDGGGDGNSSWLMIEAQGGPFKIYGNVFISPATTTGVNNGAHFGSGQAVTDQYFFYNNTVIRQGTMPGNAIYFNDGNKAAGSGNGTLFCENNIAYSASGGASAGTTSNNYKLGKISYNFFYNFGNHSGSLPTIPPGPGGSASTNPQFSNYANNDFSLAASSALRGAGDNSLGSEFDQGVAPGSTWPNPTLVARSGAWDPGAFVSNAGPAPSPTATASASPTPAPSPTPTNSKFEIGEYVKPMQTINVRATAAGSLVGTHSPSDEGVVIGGPTVANLNGTPVNWYNINWTTSPDGWSGDNNLTAAPAPSPTPTFLTTPTPSPTPAL